MAKLSADTATNVAVMRGPAKSFLAASPISATQSLVGIANQPSIKGKRRAKTNQLEAIVSHIGSLTEQLRKASLQGREDKLTVLSELLHKAKARAQELAFQVSQAWAETPIAVVTHDKVITPVKGGSLVKVAGEAGTVSRVTDDASKAQAWGSLGRAMARAQAQASASTYHPVSVSKPKVPLLNPFPVVEGIAQARKQGDRQAAYRALANEPKLGIAEDQPARDRSITNL